MKKSNFKRAWASILAASMIIGQAVPSFAAEEIPKVAETVDVRDPISDPIIGSDGIIEGYAELLKPESDSESVKPRSFFAARNSNQNIMQNEYIEYAITNGGRFSIGNKKGREDSGLDDNAVLMFGHPFSNTSYTTVFIDGHPHVFTPRGSMIKDGDTMTIVASEKIVGVKITQTLQIVSNSTDGKEDTVKISYDCENEEDAFRTVGIRIMMDTMLGGNDGAPFKVPGVGNVTTELELQGNEIPRYWQSYDSLDNPSIFAVGTLYNDITERPDKIQFANWRNIADEIGDYTITDGTPITHDSAVAMYWDEKPMYKGAKFSVSTAYGVGYAGTNGMQDQQENIANNQFGVRVLDINGGPIQGASVKLDNKTAMTNDRGMAIFSASREKNNAEMFVKKENFENYATYTKINGGTFTTVTLKTGNADCVISVIADNGNECTDLLRAKLNYSEFKEKENRDDSNDLTSTLKISANIGAEIPGATYQITQGNNIIKESNVPKFEFDVYDFIDKSTSSYGEPTLKGFEAGKNVVLRVFSNGNKVTQKELGLCIMPPTSYVKGMEKFKLGYENDFKITVPEAVPFIAKSVIKLGTEKIDLSLQVAFDEKKVKIAFNIPEDKFKKTFLSTENKKHEFYKAIDEAKKQQEYGKLRTFLEKKRLKYGEGSFAGNVDICGYGEAAYISDGRYDVAVNINIFLEVNGEYTYYTMVAVVPVYVKLEGSAQVEADGNIDLLIHTKPNLEMEGFEWDLNLNNSTELEISAGAGIPGVLSAGVGGGLELLSEYRMKNKFMKVDLQGTAFVEVNLTPLIHHKEIWPSEIWNLYAGYLESRTAEDTIDYRNINNYSVVDLRDSNEYVLNDKVRSIVVEESTLRGNVAKVIPSDNGDDFVLYTQMGNNGSINDTGIVLAKIASGSNAISESSRVLASPSDSTGESGAADEEGTADLYYDAYNDGDKIYIALGKANKKLDNSAGIIDIFKTSDIFIAEIDKKTLKTSEIKRITKNNAIDIEPKIYHDNTGTYVTWITVDSTDGNILNPDAKFTVNLYDTKTGGTKQLPIGAHSISGLSIGKIDNKVAVAYSMDVDGDLTTMTDSEIFVYDGTTKKQITDNKVSDSSPKLEKINGSNKLIWYSDGEIKESSDLKTDRVMVASPSNVKPDYSVISGNGKTMLVWEDILQKNKMIAINAVTCGENNVSGKQFELYRGEDYVTSKLAGYIGKNGATLVHINTGNVFESESAGSALLVTKDISNTDISLESCSYDSDNVKLNEELPLDLRIKNSGSTTIEEVTVCVDGEEVKNIELTLKPGEDREISVSDFVLPEIERATTYEVTVETAEDSNISNNAASIELGFTDLMINTATEIIGEEDYLSVTIGNYSYMPSGAKLQLLADSLDGAVLYENNIETIEANTTENLKLRIKDLTAGVNINRIFAVVTATVDESMLLNNQSSINVDDSISRYRLTVIAGEGGSVNQANGFYKAGDTVALTASTYEGYKFEGWESSMEDIIADVSSSVTTVTMPSLDATVTAVFQKIETKPETAKWKLKFESGVGGHVEGTLAGDYEKGTAINLKAIAEDGYGFEKWKSNDNTVIQNETSPELSFKMPEKNLSITAEFIRLSQSGDSGDSEDSSDLYVTKNLITKETCLTGGVWEWQTAGWRLKKSDGAYAKAQWVLVDNKWYVFDSDGFMLMDWQLVNGVWYYLNHLGAMQTGWIQVGGKWYYLELNGRMLKDTKTPDGYSVGNDGAMI